MNFSFSEDRNDLIISPYENLDVFCFFHVKNAVFVPSELWFSSLCASLRMKHQVLFLEKDITAFPAWDSTARWVVGDHWCWLAPRALSSLKQLSNENSIGYELMKNRLTLSK